MTVTFEGFIYSEKYLCWEGDIPVKCPVALFGHNEFALCHKNEVIEIEASEIISMLELLQHFEVDCCSLWEKDFWLVKFQLKGNLYRELEAGRKM
jgi:hypothetical protein